MTCSCPKDLPPGYTGVSAACKEHGVKCGDVPSSIQEIIEPVGYIKRGYRHEYKKGKKHAHN